MWLINSVQTKHCNTGSGRKWNKIFQLGVMLFNDLHWVKFAIKSFTVEHKTKCVSPLEFLSSIAMFWRLRSIWLPNVLFSYITAVWLTIGAHFALGCCNNKHERNVLLCRFKQSWFDYSGLPVRLHNQNSHINPSWNVSYSDLDFLLHCFHIIPPL